MSFALNPKQIEAMRLYAGAAQNIMLFGGSRSGKTFLHARSIALRALAAPHSRHVMLRFRFNHIKASLIFDTFPKMMSLCFPEIDYHLDKSDWYVKLPNASEIWFAGLDDKDRTEKILGQEYATLFFNEASQIPWGSRSMAMTRLAQRVEFQGPQGRQLLRLKALYDCNPPSQAHWTYKLFIQRRDPDTGKPLPHPEDYESMRLNPKDNASNLAPEYLRQLENLPPRMRLRFLEGEFSDVSTNALWRLETIEKWRDADRVPDLQRIVIAVDPSGTGDDENADNDAVGIIVAGLGVDGNGYVLEDLTLKAGPKTWGTVVGSAFERHRADLVVGETNYGGEMVSFVIKAARPGTPFRKVVASRGKVVRAEPIALLAEDGKIRHAGRFPDLEDELCAFTTAGYVGSRSPNRADAYVWAFTELFPGLTRREQKLAVPEMAPQMPLLGHNLGWMS